MSKENSQERGTPQYRGRVLALDIGAKRVGVAVSDELRLTVRPLAALRGTNWKQLVKALLELCEEFDVREVVLGLPLRLDGVEGDAAKEVRGVARKLELTLRLPIGFQDERLTSKTAEAALRREGLGEREVLANADSEAATIILRDYLARPAE
ncbi:MAG: Holliday junction resolvase RuvX [Pyrinomonadaceae bacterium]